MGDNELGKMNADLNEAKKNGKIKVINPALAGFFVQLPHKLQNGLKVRCAK